MIIGTRILTVLTADGERPVAVRLSTPVAVETKWDCSYEIDWPEGVWRSHAQGNDALHALELAMQKIGMDLYMSRYHHEQKMWWIRPWVGYGFPMPKDARDLMIGDDARFYGQ